MIYSGIAFSVACFVVIVLAGILISRFNRRRKNDLAEDAGLDLMGLRKKNLLTPEEMQMVSQALMRRMAEKDQKQKNSAGLNTATLLHDPEVQRLQELARQQREQEQNAAPSSQQSISAEAAPSETLAAPSPQQTTADPVEESVDLTQIELPPEVQQLADAGILTEEEIANVRRRLWAKQSQQNLSQ